MSWNIKALMNGLARTRMRENISGKVLASIFMRMPETGGRLIGRGEVSIEIEAESQSESMIGGNPASVNEF